MASIQRIVITSIGLLVEYDYNDIKYPVPFNTLYHDITYRYVNFGKPNPSLPSFVLTGYIPEMKDQFSELLVMTGASDNHGYGSFNLMYSVLLADPFASLIYIDLGLSNKLVGYLSAHFDTLHQIQLKMKSTGFLAYRKFNYASFPAWMNLLRTGREKRGGYAWKVIPMFDAFHEWKGMFSWLDGGDVITDGFSRELTFARRYGIYVPSSSGTIGKWTNPGMIEFMKNNGLATKVKLTDPNCSSGIVYMDYSNRTVQEIMAKHVECAWTQKCIVPKRASIKNHRFDQASLSMLLNEYKIQDSMRGKYSFVPGLRNENENIRQILANLIVSIEQVFHIRLTNKKYNVPGMKYRKTKLRYARSEY